MTIHLRAVLFGANYIKSERIALKNSHIFVSVYQQDSRNEHEATSSLKVKTGDKTKFPERCWPIPITLGLEFPYLDGAKIAWAELESFAKKMMWASASVSLISFTISVLSHQSKSKRNVFAITSVFFALIAGLSYLRALKFTQEKINIEPLEKLQREKIERIRGLAYDNLLKVCYESNHLFPTKDFLRINNRDKDKYKTENYHYSYSDLLNLLTDIELKSAFSKHIVINQQKVSASRIRRFLHIHTEFMKLLEQKGYNGFNVFIDNFKTLLKVEINKNLNNEYLNKIQESLKIFEQNLNKNGIPFNDFEDASALLWSDFVKSDSLVDYEKWVRQLYKNLFLVSIFRSACSSSTTAPEQDMSYFSTLEENKPSLHKKIVQLHNGFFEN